MDSQKQQVNGSWTPFEDVSSDWMAVRTDDTNFAPPAVTNEWAMVAAGRDVFSYVGYASPPVFMHEQQASLYVAVDGGEDVSIVDAGGSIRHRWWLDRIEREMAIDDFQFRSRMALSDGNAVLLLQLHIENRGSTAKSLRIALAVDPDVAPTDWIFDPGYEQRRPKAVWDGEAEAWLFCDKERKAWACVKSSPTPTVVPERVFLAKEPYVKPGVSEDNGNLSDPSPESHLHGGLPGTEYEGTERLMFVYEWTVDAGETVTMQWVHTLAQDGQTAAKEANDHMSRFDAVWADVADAWRRRWDAAFTPGNDCFSGHMPTLVTDDVRLQRMYDMAVATVLYCRRDPVRWVGSGSKVYATGFPSSRFTFRVTSAFLWDIKMIAGTLSMLDPEVLRSMMELWLEAGLHNGYGVDFVTGEPLGFWYAINDHAIIHMAWQYVRYTGDTDWLLKKVKGKPVIEHLLTSARYWRRLAGDDGLADYGTADNLLECVSTYTHKVAAFNAANVWNMRTVARMIEVLVETDGEAGVSGCASSGGVHGVRSDTRAWREGMDAPRAVVDALRAEVDALRDEADALAQQVLTLYVPGEGYWMAKQPDDTSHTVRHVIDFFTVMITMHDDLTPAQREEMVAFFHRELKQPTWMHALSPLDPDAAFSSRTDHQDEGAYTTWPAYALEALVQAGHIEDAFDWLGVGRQGPGLTDVAKQGPYGQAYFNGGPESPMVAGAAAKAPMEHPHIEKPVLVSGGKYAQIVIEQLAGIDPDIVHGMRRSDVPRFSPTAFTLRNVPVHGQLYRVDV